MAVQALNHANIQTVVMDASIAFFRDVLGMTVDPVPGMVSLVEGAWLYSAEGRPAIHLNAVTSATDFLGEARPPHDVTGAGRIHHIAFDCVDYDDVDRRIAAAGLTVQRNDVEALGLRQLFVRDPNGILIELNFRG